VTVWFRHSFHFCTFKCKWSSRRFFIREMTADYLYRWLFRNFLWFLLANSFTVHNLWTIKNENLAYWEITVNGVNGIIHFFLYKSSSDSGARFLWNKIWNPSVILFNIDHMQILLRNTNPNYVISIWLNHCVLTDKTDHQIWLQSVCHVIRLYYPVINRYFDHGYVERLKTQFTK